MIQIILVWNNLLKILKGFLYIFEIRFLNVSSNFKYNCFYKKNKKPTFNSNN